MNKEQALQILKQALDNALKLGICTNIDSAAILAQAWQIVLKTLNNEKSV